MGGKLGSKREAKEALILPLPSAPVSSLCSAFELSKTSDLLPLHPRLDATFTEVWGCGLWLSAARPRALATPACTRAHTRTPLFLIYNEIQLSWSK